MSIPNQKRNQSGRFTNWLAEFPCCDGTERKGSASKLGIAILISMMACLVLVYAALNLRSESGRHATADGMVRVYCASGVVPPLEKIIDAYNRQPPGIKVELVRAGGSGELAGQIKTEFATGIPFGAELHITADDELLAQAQRDGVVQERFPLAVQTPVIAVAANSELAIATLADLVQLEDIRFGIAAQGAAIGKTTRDIARRDGLLELLEEKKSTDSENVMTLAQALVAGSLDAAVVWDTTVSQINATGDDGEPILKIAAMADGQDKFKSHIAIGVVASTKKPEACLDFARYLTAPENGGQVFLEFGYSLAR